MLTKIRNSKGKIEVLQSLTGKVKSRSNRILLFTCNMTRTRKEIKGWKKRLMIFAMNVGLLIIICIEKYSQFGKRDGRLINNIQSYKSRLER